MKKYIQLNSIPTELHELSSRYTHIINPLKFVNIFRQDISDKGKCFPNQQKPRFSTYFLCENGIEFRVETYTCKSRELVISLMDLETPPGDLGVSLGIDIKKEYKDFENWLIDKGCGI